MGYRATRGPGHPGASQAFLGAVFIRAAAATTAALAGARLPITVDFRFGYAIAHGTEDVYLSVLLDMLSPYLRAYPPETVIAEKVHAMVALRRANSRVKHHHDV
jgi:Nucleotidyl transferase AbiEii toxin, Type IV TA system